MKLNVMAWANTTAVFMGIVYLFCSFAISLFPEASKVVTQSWFHGINYNLIWTGETRGNFLLGLISAVGLSWIAGWIFAFIYNRLSK